MAKTKTSWKDKRCPKCGSEVDRMETCRKCSRAWTKELERDETGHIIEEAIGLEPGKQYDSVVKKVGSRKPRKTRFTKSKEKPAGKKFKAFSEDLPPQFAEWSIGESDDETEIYRKRSLMRLDSRRLYNAMGLSVRAFDSQKATLLWLSRMWEFLDQEERDRLEPSIRSLKAVFDVLSTVKNSKIAQTVKMEKAMEKAHQQARRVRMVAAEKTKKEASKFPAQESDSEGLGLMPAPIDSDLLEQVQEKLLRLEKDKVRGKTNKREEFEERE